MPSDALSLATSLSRNSREWQPAKLLKPGSRELRVAGGRSHVIGKLAHEGLMKPVCTVK